MKEKSSRSSVTFHFIYFFYSFCWKSGERKGGKKSLGRGGGEKGSSNARFPAFFCQCELVAALETIVAD